MIKNGIKISKSQSRGDEVGLLFFLLVIFFFLIVSLTRFSIIGKVLDDFLFSFLFGWMKYAVYFFLFLMIIPLAFGYRMQFKLKYIFVYFLFLVISCWTTQTLTLIILGKNNLWTSYYNLNLLNISEIYVKTWWNTNAINNYLGFFASPISFKDFSVETFFPTYATGGIISNVLIGIFNYGFFVTNLIANFISIFSLTCLFIFNKPFIFFSKMKQIIKQIIINNKNKKQKNKINADLKQKHIKLKKEKLLIDKQVKKTFRKENSFNKESKKEPPISPVKKAKIKQNEIKQNEIKQNDNSDIINKPSSPIVYFNENSYLTPFGKIDPEKQKDVMSNSKGTLVVKKSLEDSILNREILNDNETIINNES
ncbi:hypothetical protein [Spiroplasma ixodetis]|uniref:hypothetical protein n=1 Tax=Spiroplasma ixodetis TaxID=2141 RepID=UPI0025772DB9|nr:hypothetical protein [Spiroplasma ixodetis]WJG71043.1 hypothetical protein SIXOD_v1c23600 [Spiroplasma ixodetis Y32]